mgnify:CR=1 FL=1
MINVNVPCKNCADRKIGCHGVCKDYIEYQSRNEQIKKNKKKQQQYESLKFRPDHVLEKMERKARNGC